MTIRFGDVDGSEVLYRTERRFKVWRYGVGHSQLLLRSGPDSSDRDSLDLLFEDVSAVRLVMHYESLELYRPEKSESEEILDYAGIEPSWRARRLVIALRSAKSSGFVVCANVNAIRRGSTAIGADDGFKSDDVVWSCRA